MKFVFEEVFFNDF